LFPISRDPPEGGTRMARKDLLAALSRGFQFLGIPPKGEPRRYLPKGCRASCFQFLGIPPKGEHLIVVGIVENGKVSNF